MRSLRLRGLMADLVNFALIGGIGFLVDIGLFNLLRSTILGEGSVHGAVLFAKAISVSAAIVTNWAGNRWWTFRDRRQEKAVSEALTFFAVSLAGSGIALVCLVVSHYLLGLTTTLADNISANVVGLILGSVFRFVAARAWVFRAAPAQVGA